CQGVSTTTHSSKPRPSAVYFSNIRLRTASSSLVGGDPNGPCLSDVPFTRAGLARHRRYARCLERMARAAQSDLEQVAVVLREGTCGGTHGWRKTLGQAEILERGGINVMYPEEIGFGCGYFGQAIHGPVFVTGFTS